MARLSALLVVLSITLSAQNVASLKRVTPPQPDLTQYVRDTKALIVLGKALFWDMQAGSDGLGPVAMLAADGLHPSAAMYARWADAALPVARALLR